QLVETWADGHLMAAWVLTWVVGFAALALLAPTARNLAGRVIQGLNGWSRDLAHRRADERLWALARKDPRVMADIRAAALREELVLDAGQGQVALKGTFGDNAGFGGGQGPDMNKSAQKEASASATLHPEEFVALMAANRALRPEVAARLARLSRRIWID
ncbi:hypothetical protein ACQV5M_20510, partial [Leptospira sp. SA-E8]|uniref:hypothetical protein n=1 Tax=Leptospira sp. SA-E8 TaxID=3422259 RepID=UPI003EC03DA8